MSRPATDRDGGERDERLAIGWPTSGARLETNQRED
jgi:hypothetical protein